MSLFALSKEEQIIRMFRKGHPRAMDILYTEFGGYLTGVCSLYISQEENQHDVMQESFIKVYTKINTFKYRGKGTLKSWLAKIVVNEALMFLRKRKPAIFVDTEIEQLKETYVSPDVDTITDEQIATLIGKLPPGCRTVFNLYVIEGKNHAEIGKLLNIKPASSASQYHRAKQLLAEMIKKEREEEG